MTPDKRKLRTRGRTRLQPATRNSSGFVLAEATASTSIFAGITFCVLCLVIQAGISMHITNGLNQSARQAARELSILYIKSGGGDQPDATSQQTALRKAMVPGAVNQVSQYTVVWPSTFTKNAHPPQTVSVLCTAAPGQAGSNGMVKNLGLPWTSVNLLGKTFSLNVFQMRSSATYPLRP